AGPRGSLGPARATAGGRTARSGSPGAGGAANGARDAANHDRSGRGGPRERDARFALRASLRCAAGSAHDDATLDAHHGSERNTGTPVSSRAEPVERSRAAALGTVSRHLERQTVRNAPKYADDSAAQSARVGRGTAEFT